MPSTADLAQLVSDLLREGRPVELVMLGNSMRPLIESGRVLRIEPASADDVRLGDVVLVDVDGGHLCHRLVHAGAKYVVTRGDANGCADEPAPRASVIGRVAIPPSPHAVYCAVRALVRSLA